MGRDEPQQMMPFGTGMVRPAVCTGRVRLFEAILKSRFAQVPRAGFAPRGVRGIAGSAGSPRPPARARRAHRRRDWPHDRVSPETARHAVRSSAPFATARSRSRPAALLGRRGIGRVALQQDLAADAVHLRFVQALFGALQRGERVVQAPEPRHQSRRHSLRLRPEPLRLRSATPQNLFPDQWRSLGAY